MNTDPLKDAFDRVSPGPVRWADARTLQARAGRHHRRRRGLIVLAVAATVALAAGVVVAVGLPSSSVPVVVTSPRPTGTSVATTTTPEPIVGGACAGQPPGCAASAGTAQALARGSWSKRPAPPSTARSGEVSVWTGTTLIIWGGDTTSAGKSRFLDDGAAYDPSTRTWTKLPPSPLSGRADASAAWDGTAMLVWGGISHFDSSNNTDQLASGGAAYSPTTRTWTPLPNGPLSGRDSATMLWTGTDALIFGGVTAGDKWSTQGATYQPATGRWTLLPTFPKPPHGSPIGTAAAWTGHDLMVVETYETIRTYRSRGGITTSISRSTVAAAWQEGGSVWLRLPPPPSQAAFYQATGVWTGQQLVLVGGTYCLPEMSCPAQLSSEAWAYDPASRRWLSLPDSPLVGTGDPIIWTGNAIVAMAGFSPAVARVYDPRHVAWYKLPPKANAAFGDTGAIAAWTGKELLVLTSPFAPRGKAAAALFYALIPRRKP